MKKFLLSILVAGVSAITCFAAPYAVTFPGNSTATNLNVGGVSQINNWTIYNPSASSATVELIDSPNMNLSWTNGSYTNFTISTATVTNVYTNVFGVLNSNVYTVMTNTANVVSGNTNLYRIVAIGTIPAGSYLSSTNGGLLMNGLLITNIGSANATNLVFMADIGKRY